VNGSLFRSEIREQPAALDRLLARRDDFAAVACAIAARAPDAVRLAGHGSSDNAASYGVYVFGHAAARAREAGATILASGNAASEIAGAAYTLPVPEAPNKLLAPLLSVVPGQLFAAALADAKGLDPDQPHGLSKVTLAR
jgi:fructoselysine-6-P-deglycase FrlB-like protein